MVNKSVILRKVSLVRHNLSRLKGKENVSLESLKNDLDIQDIVLHNLQLAIQGCIDIGSHVISDEGWGVAGSLNEIFVPKIPSMSIVDLAKAIAPDCSHHITGIRPGEKLHESLIGEDEGRNTIENNECYVIRQKLSYENKLSNIDNGGRLCPEGFQYTSDNNP